MSQGAAAIDFTEFDAIPVERSGPLIDKIGLLKEFGNIGNIPEFLTRNLRLCGYTRPTPVQKHAIPCAFAGRDVMCCAQTGSGKTCAFLLPAVARMDADYIPPPESDSAAAPRVVILSPTRELASQIWGEARKLVHRSSFRATQVYGGVEARPQLTELARGCDICVATPGRLIDFIKRGVMSMRRCLYLVLDEADRMLDMGFEPQIRDIVEGQDMPSSKDGRQTLLFSATFPREIQLLASDFLKLYVWVGVGRVGSTTENITQRVVQVEEHSKVEQMLPLLEEVEGRTLLFVEQKKTASWLLSWLTARSVSATAIHGDRTQSEREAALSDFKSGRARVLVATDVAARGLDIAEVKHVINYDMPGNIDDYVHRIGRTARIGSKGHATSLYATGPTGSNRNVGQQVYKLMSDHGQEIPPWFEAEFGGAGGRGRGGKAAGAGASAAAAAGASGESNQNLDSTTFGGQDARDTDKVRLPTYLSLSAPRGVRCDKVSRCVRVWTYRACRAMRGREGAARTMINLARLAAVAAVAVRVASVAVAEAVGVAASAAVAATVGPPAAEEEEVVTLASAAAWAPVKSTVWASRHLLHSRRRRRRRRQWMCNTASVCAELPAWVNSGTRAQQHVQLLQHAAPKQRPRNHWRAGQYLPSAAAAGATSPLLRRAGVHAALDSSPHQLLHLLFLLVTRPVAVDHRHDCGGQRWHLGVWVWRLGADLEDVAAYPDQHEYAGARDSDEHRCHLACGLAVPATAPRVPHRARRVATAAGVRRRRLHIGCLDRRPSVLRNVLGQHGGGR